MKKKRPNAIVTRLKRVPTVYYLVGVAFLVILIGAIVVGSSANDQVNANNSQVLPESEVAILQAEVQWTRESFLIENTTSQSWSACKFEVNAQEFGTGFGFYKETVEQGVITAIPHSQLHKADGSVYDYAATPPERFTIRCKDAGAGKPGVFVGSRRS